MLKEASKISEIKTCILALEIRQTFQGIMISLIAFHVQGDERITHFFVKKIVCNGWIKAHV